MRKFEFLSKIKEKLKDFDEKEIIKITDFYDELISDMVDSGISEEEAVSKYSDIDKIVKDIKTDLIIERSNTKKTNTLKNFVLILGLASSPVLIPIAIVFVVVFIVLLVTLFTVFISLAASGIAVILAGFYGSITLFIEGGNISNSLITLGVTLFGGAILTLFAYYLFIASQFVLNKTNLFFTKLIKRKEKNINENI